MRCVGLRLPSTEDSIHFSIFIFQGNASPPLHLDNRKEIRHSCWEIESYFLVWFIQDGLSSNKRLDKENSGWRSAARSLVHFSQLFVWMEAPPKIVSGVWIPYIYLETNGIALGLCQTPILLVPLTMEAYGNTPRYRLRIFYTQTVAVSLFHGVHDLFSHEIHQHKTYTPL